MKRLIWLAESTQNCGSFILIRDVSCILHLYAILQVDLQLDWCAPQLSILGAQGRGATHLM